jgi:hypothetical protein
MRGHGCKLTRLLRTAVEAYLEGLTWTLAARRVGIARSTFCIWMKLPEFRRMVDQILQERFRQGRPQVKANDSSSFDVNRCGVNKDRGDRQTGRAAA